MFYGRTYELNIIKKAIVSKRAELGIVYGRRRIGKSSLLLKGISRKGDLYFEALQNVSNKKQINHFLHQLSVQTKSPKSIADNWHEAFDILTFHMKKKRCYVVFDEFPWMASGRTELVSLVKYYWDNYWKKNPNLTMVICGSIANFMFKHIVHSKALHNRKTFEIKLAPLSACESKLFFKQYRSPYEIAKFLMVFGGIPKYLEQVDPQFSFSENIDRLCFQKSSFFVNEFETIFKEQFIVIKNYERIVRQISQKSMSKEALGRQLNIPSGGGLSSYIYNLEQADFIKVFKSNAPFGASREKTRKIVLWDEWLQFYFHYIAPNKRIIALNTEPGLFEKVSGQSLNSFFGLVFEKFCMKNLSNIFKHMGVDIHQVVDYGPFFRQKNRTKSLDEGLQIDILVRKKGQMLTLIECKFQSNPIGTSVISDVQRKIQLLKAPKSYSIERILVTAGEVTSNLNKNDYFHHILGIESLFQ